MPDRSCDRNRGHHDGGYCLQILPPLYEAMPDNLDLSVPTTFTKLPFPSLLLTSFKRFDTKRINGIRQFEYTGGSRGKFRGLQNRIADEDFRMGTKAYTYTGRLVQGNCTFSQRLSITLFVKESASSIVWIVPNFFWSLQK